MVKHVIIWVLVAFAIYSLVTTPHETAEVVHTAGAALQALGQSVIEFFRELSSE